MSHYQPVERKVFTVPFMVLGLIGVVGLYFLAQRFIHGMGPVTNLNGGYAWGIWVVYDIVVGTALACGGYALAITVYVLNKGKYHPLIRAAVTASLLGYALGGVGAFVDMGRWFQFYNILLPWNMNFNSVMLEVGLCVMTYILVLAIEFLPAVFERFGMKDWAHRLNKVLFLFIALGILLPTMHQSSLGSMLIAMGYKVHPLWQSLHLQPLLALLTAIIMGFAIVIFEASFSTVGFARNSETKLISGLGKGIIGLVSAYLIFRFGEILLRGKFGLIFAGDLGSLMFIIETALFVFPLAVLLSAKMKADGRMLLYAGVSLLFAGALYRFNAYLITMDPGPGYSYFPSFPELMVTVGMVAIEIMAYLVIVKKFPVLPKHAPA